MDDLIKISTLIAFLVFSSGKISKSLLIVRKAQIQLIQQSKASFWPKVILLNTK